MKLMKQEQANVGKLTVMPAATPNFLVFDAFGASARTGCATLYEVNMASGHCSRCVVSEQLNIPCRHILAVIFRLASENKATPLLYRPQQYFHSAYLVTNLHAAMSTFSIHMPSDSAYEVSQALRPPPYYRQAGQSLQQTAQKADRSSRFKRKRNKGEGNGKGSTSRLNTPPTASAGIERATAARDGRGDEAIDAEDDGPAIAPTVKKRQQYRCGQCGETGHNTKRCTNTNQEREETGVPIKPGRYLVGSCPFAICGIHSGYEAAADS
ncbi:hypothetical protein GN958_ATG02910 [Phytophthora infestans]|uniref:SWIM-type domain-containing protein n=1 Tax=Phytophthora infestans TaxID=4787 RepID=A0A8S9VBM0_PHYIN|nr:hypothetical protein GN958_ATG02910 [Phytophthora infestans]